MNHMSRIFMHSLLLTCIIALSGCGNKKQQKSDISHKAPSSKKNSRNHKNNVSQETIAPFLLDESDMQTFALDDSLPAHASQLPAQKTTPKANNLFSWEQVEAEDSKQLFKKLFFEFNKYDLKKDQQAALKYNIGLAKTMAKDHKLIVVEGHACHSEGSAIYNLALSEKRAAYVAQLLVDAGIPREQIKIAPRGQDMPLRRGGNRQEQSVNRRVEMYAINQ